MIYGQFFTADPILPSKQVEVALPEPKNFFFENFFKKMRNIILSDLDRFWDFLLKGNGRKWPIYDFIKIGKIVKI